ncbi:golgin subfamily a member 6-like protein 2-related [Anaeramoeba flamelloides]|uniref:Golgin subfamily a member 6-like protein 2-related n=1 Tax=Anaeramoeba flamelloides TaxID=1746091 RepID=A0AAV7ZJ60_9EUKA|nr:golgin subfamily a member 6-like protein 2-related [Anaeramoeba flamelloides]
MNFKKRIKIREQMEERRNKLENECDEMKAKIAKLENEHKQDERIKEQNLQIDKQDQRIDKQNLQIDKQDERIKEQNLQIDKQDQRIKEQDQRIKEQNVLIKEQNLLIDNFTIILQNKRIGINQLTGTVHKLKINNSNKEKIPNDDYLENEFTKFLEMELLHYEPDSKVPTLVTTKTIRESIDKQIGNINFPNKTNQTTINVIQKKVFGEFYKKSYPVNKYKEFKLENLDDSDQLIDFTLGNYIIQNKNPNLNKELKKYQKLILIGVSGCGKTRSIYELGNKQFVIYLIGCGIGSYSLDNSFQRCMFHINNFMNKGNYKKQLNDPQVCKELNEHLKKWEAKIIHKDFTIKELCMDYLVRKYTNKMILILVSVKLYFLYHFLKQSNGSLQPNQFFSMAIKFRK